MSSTNLTRNGFGDWLIQRLSALILLVFILWMLGLFVFSSQFSYDVWHGYFSHIAMKTFTFVALLALLGHIWVGLWTIITDYIKSVYLQLTLYALLILFILIVFFWVCLLLLSL